MPGKTLKFDKEARMAIRKGINTLADAVESTLGPKGRCVIITNYDHKGNPKITKDGVTVAKAVELLDPMENAGACLIREAANKVVNAVGDATTTTTVLARALIDGIEERLELGLNPVVLRNVLERDAKAVLEKIKKEAIEIKDEDLEHIATISANNDRELGKLIGDAYKKVGKHGIVTVEESSTVNTYADFTMGMQFENGYIANHFVTDSIKDQCVLEKPLIFITEHKIARASDMATLLNYVAKEKRSLLIIAQDYDDAVLEVLKLNKLEGRLKVCPVKAPSHGEYRKGFLQDIAVATGATVITYDSGLEVSDTTVADLGGSEKIIVTKNDTTIVNGIGTPDEINTRVETLKNELASVLAQPGMDGTFMEKFLNARIAKLLGGCCRLYVGGATTMEIQERKDRVEDAVCAVKAALKGGVVRGAGVTYKDIAESLGTKISPVIYNALLAPMKALMNNAGCGYDIPRAKHAGYDLVNNVYRKDILKANVIDPALACYEAFANAMSVATMYLSTTCVIAPVPEVTVLPPLM